MNWPPAANRGTARQSSNYLTLLEQGSNHSSLSCLFANRDNTQAVTTVSEGHIGEKITRRMLEDVKVIDGLWSSQHPLSIHVNIRFRV